MQLFYSPTSPFVRKVMVVLHETGQLDDVELLDTTVTPPAPDAALMAKNPLSKVPALERGDGPALYDSRVICAYLDDKAHGGLYPRGPARWDMLTLEATADGIMDAAVLMTYEGRIRPEERQWDGWIEAQWGKAERAVAAVNDRWMPHLTGPVNIGQIAVACALSYLDFRHGARNWRAGHASLADWYAGFAARNSMVATAPPE
ncbi:MAG: glutathione S-transferase [Marinibacterium sp.]